jgi:hypothetical protein
MADGNPWRPRCMGNPNQIEITPMSVDLVACWRAHIASPHEPLHASLDALAQDDCAPSVGRRSG